jgi:signal transduction histidine kinase
VSGGDSPAPQDHDRVLLDSDGAAAALIKNKERITDLFVARVREMLPPETKTTRPMTIDTLPAFLTSLGLALSDTDNRSFASHHSTIAIQHGTERAKLTNYSLANLVQEYRILREILLDVLLSGEELAASDWKTVHLSIDNAICEAVSAYVQVHTLIRGQFTATLTHDIRGPLTAASNYLQLIARSEGKEAERTRFAQRALGNIEEIDRIIVELLDSARAHAGERLQLQLAQCELTELVRRVVDDFKARVGDRFRLHCDRPVHGHWSGHHLARAVYNLLENALKYGVAGSPIDIRVLEEEGRAVISVHNFGKPIPKEERAVLFEAYRRGRSAESSGQKGWGLGLAMVQAIAEAHGGSAGIDTTDDGNTFSIDILKDARAFQEQADTSKR